MFKNCCLYVFKNNTQYQFTTVSLFDLVFSIVYKTLTVYVMKIFHSKHQFFLLAISSVYHSFIIWSCISHCLHNTNSLLWWRSFTKNISILTISSGYQSCFIILSSLHFTLSTETLTVYCDEIFSQNISILTDIISLPKLYHCLVLYFILSTKTLTVYCDEGLSPKTTVFFTHNIVS